MKWIFFSLLMTSLHCLAQDSVTIGIVGDISDAQVKTESGVVLMGGSTDVDEAFRWMIDKAKGGDFVILRASGSTGYNDYVYNLGTLNSVETLLINSREKANLPETSKRLRDAEAVFIAGGDQANYVNFWAGTEVSKALDYLINEKKIPIGGTSAGCAVLSDIIFDALHDTVLSEEALANPYDEKVSLSKSFIRIPVLKDIITDQHYSQRKRQGRSVSFLARMKKDMGIDAKSIAVDEKTALCIDANGDAKVFGVNKVFFIAASKKNPEIIIAGSPLHWYQKQKALSVHIFNGSKEGTATLNILKWTVKNPDQYWYVENGVLKGN